MVIAGTLALWCAPACSLPCSCRVGAIALGRVLHVEPLAPYGGPSTSPVPQHCHSSDRLWRVQGPRMWTQALWPMPSLLALYQGPLSLREAHEHSYWMWIIPWVKGPWEHLSLFTENIKLSPHCGNPGAAKTTPWSRNWGPSGRAATINKGNSVPR